MYLLRQGQCYLKYSFNVQIDENDGNKQIKSLEARASSARALHSHKL